MLLPGTRELNPGFKVLPIKESGWNLHLNDSGILRWGRDGEIDGETR